ncbi:MAG: hypothetical protein WC330_04905, partial [Candidatus Omnitrophota bacterium]
DGYTRANIEKGIVGGLAVVAASRAGYLAYNHAGAIASFVGRNSLRAVNPTTKLAVFTYPAAGAAAYPYFTKDGYTRANIEKGIVGGLAVVAASRAGYLAYNHAGAIASFVGRNYTNTIRPVVVATAESIGLNRPFVLLGGSTAAAFQEFNSPKTMLDAIGPFAGITGILMNPGRNIIYTIGALSNNGWDKRITLIKGKEQQGLDKYLTDNVPSVAAFASTFGLSFADLYLQTLTGSITVRALSNPLEEIKGTLAFASIFKNNFIEEGQSNPPAAAAQWGRLVGGVFGTTLGLRHLGNNIARATDAPYLIRNGKFQASPSEVFRPVAELSFTQTAGYYIAEVHNLASGMMKWNTGIGLVFPTLRSSDQLKALSESAYRVAYGLDLFASSSVTVAALFTAASVGYGKIAGSSLVRSISENKFVSGEYLRIGDVYLGKAVTPVSMVGVGSGMYYLGTEGKVPFTSVTVFEKVELKDGQGNILVDNAGKPIIGVNSLLANYIANGGLVIAGIGGLLGARNLRQTTQLKYKPGEVKAGEPIVGANGSLTNRVFGTGAKGTTGMLYTSGYALSGGVAGLTYGWMSGADMSNPYEALSYFGTGALAGITIRHAPMLVPLATEIASVSAISYGAVKGVFDPAVSRIEYWLNDRNDFDWTEASKPHLFDAYSIRDYNTFGSDLQNLTKDTTTGLYKHPTIAGKFIDPENGRILTRSGISGKLSYERIQTGKFTNDWKAALINGTIIWGILKVGRAARKSYVEGDFKTAKGVLRGTWEDGALKRWESPNMLGRLSSWYEYGSSHPFVAGTGIAATGLGSYYLGTQTSLNTTDLGKGLEYFGYGLVALGALTAGSRVFGQTNAFSGAALAGTRAVIWDFATQGTALNLVTVIAPLQGVVEGTSLFYKTYASPSIYTDFGRTVSDSTVGAFWNEHSAKKYGPAIENWNKAETLSQYLSVSAQFAGRAYLAGLGYINEKGENTIKSYDLAGMWNALDKTSLTFSAVLAPLQVFAEPFLGNIRVGNFGHKFQVIGSGIEGTFGEVFGKASSERIAAGQASIFDHVTSGISRFGNMAITGTVEEVGVEQAIETAVLRFIPFNAIFGQKVGTQVSEVLQEVFSPSVALKAKTHQQFYQGEGRVVRMEVPGAASSLPGQAQSAASQLTGRQVGSIRSDANALELVSTSLPTGTKIVVDEAGVLRTYTVGGQEWKNFFEVRQHMAEFQSQLDAAGHVGSSGWNAQLHQLAVRGSSEETLAGQAAKAVVARSAGDAVMVGRAMSGRGILSVGAEGAFLYDPSLNPAMPNTGIAVDLDYVAAERLANDVSFRQAVAGVANSLPSSAGTFWQGRSAILMHQLGTNRWNYYNTAAQLQQTGDEYLAGRLGRFYSNVSRFSTAIAIEEELARPNIGLSGHSEVLSGIDLVRRGLFTLNWHTLSYFGFGKAGILRNQLTQELLVDGRLMRPLQEKLSLAREEETLRPSSKATNKVREIERQIKKLNNFINLKGIGALRKAALLQFEAKSFVEFQPDTLFAAKANVLLNNPAGSGIVVPAGTDIVKLRQEIAKHYEYDVWGITNEIRPLLDVDMFDDKARATLAKYSDGATADALVSYVPIEYVDYNTIVNEDTGSGTSAQNRPDSKRPGARYVAVDAFQNFAFRQTGDMVHALPNATGEFNVGAGAHEFIHSLIDYKLISPQLTGESDEDYNIRRLGALRRNPLMTSLLDELEVIPDNRPAVVDLDMKENHGNEILTQAISAREVAVFINNNPGLGLQYGIMDPTAHFLAKLLTKSYEPIRNNNIFETIADLNDRDIVRLPYNYVLGPHTVKTDTEVSSQAEATAILREAREAVAREFNINNNLREAELRSIFIQEVHRLAGLRGVSARVIEIATSLSSGRNTSIFGYQPKHEGRRLSLSDAVKLEAVVEVGGQRAEEAYSFVVTRAPGTRLNLNEIEYFDIDSTTASATLLEKDEFERRLNRLRRQGMTPRQRTASRSIYEGFVRADAALRSNGFGGLGNAYALSASSPIYSDFTKSIQSAMQAYRIAHNFGSWYKIHDFFGAKELYSLPLAHFDDGMPVDGKIQLDTIVLEPYISVPGGEGFARGIQLKLGTISDGEVASKLKPGTKVIKDNNINSLENEIIVRAAVNGRTVEYLGVDSVTGSQYKFVADPLGLPRITLWEGTRQIKESAGKKISEDQGRAITLESDIAIDIEIEKGKVKHQTGQADIWAIDAATGNRYKVNFDEATGSLIPFLYGKTDGTEARLLYKSDELVETGLKTIKPYVQKAKNGINEVVSVELDASGNIAKELPSEPIRLSITGKYEGDIYYEIIGIDGRSQASQLMEKVLKPNSTVGMKDGKPVILAE